MFGNFVDSILSELYAHQEWADAEHWRAIEATPVAIDDKAIRDRLLHIHLVQHGFLWVTARRTEEFVIRKAEDFPDIIDLKIYAQRGLTDLKHAVEAFSPAQIEAVIEVPWFRPPARISRRQALMQAAMHSHYHRGQNATRLRELGGNPPMTDFIVWLHKGKPAAQWESA